MAAKKSKSKKSSITDEPPPPPPFSLLPPINPSDRPRPYKPGVIKQSFDPAITKSCLPTTTTRCTANQNQPLQLRRVTTGPPQNPTPHPHYHYLHDSTKIIEAASKTKTRDASYWRVLRHDPTAWSTNPDPDPDPDPELHTDQSYPKLHWSSFRSLNGPSSGLLMGHAVSLAVYRQICVSVWHECVTPDPFDPRKKPMEFTSNVFSQGNYYVMSLQGALAVMRVVDTRLVITAVAAGRGVPRSRWRFFKEYLCEMNGEILLVFLIHWESLAVVDHVEVLRLDLVKMDWVKVERLQGKAMFLNQYCRWVDSEEFGCRDDRVYFTEGSENIWKVYNMKTCSISLVPAGWCW